MTPCTVLHLRLRCYLAAREVIDATVPYSTAVGILDVRILQFLIVKDDGDELDAARQLAGRRRRRSNIDLLDFGGFNISERLTLLKPL